MDQALQQHTERLTVSAIPQQHQPQLQQAGLLRCTTLTVRTPQLFGAGRGAELKHYFPVPGVGLSWVAASGSG